MFKVINLPHLVYELWVGNRKLGTFDNVETPTRVLAEMMVADEILIDKWCDMFRVASGTPECLKMEAEHRELSSKFADAYGVEWWKFHGSPSLVTTVPVLNTFTSVHWSKE